MARSDVPAKWQETISFAVISTPRRLRLSNQFDGDARYERWKPFEYVEVDNRPNPTAVIFWALNGRTASSTLATAAPAKEEQPQFRLPQKDIDRVFVLATSISVMTTVATTIYVTAARY